MDSVDWDWMWHAFEAFASYSFNLAHATVYGITAYRCAYLSRNYPTEFFAALLSVWSGEKKEPVYVKAARYKGVSIRRPDVNKSEVVYTVGGKTSIRKGLLAIKGIGLKTAEKIVSERPIGGYSSVKELCELSGVSGSKPFLRSGDSDVGVIGKLYAAGAIGDLK